MDPSQFKLLTAKSRTVLPEARYYQICIGVRRIVAMVDELMAVLVAQVHALCGLAPADITLVEGRS